MVVVVVIYKRVNTTCPLLHPHTYTPIFLNIENHLPFPPNLPAGISWNFSQVTLNFMEAQQQ